jgi:hypothetical protein
MCKNSTDDDMTLNGCANLKDRRKLTPANANAVTMIVVNVNAVIKDVEEEESDKEPTSPITSPDSAQSTSITEQQPSLVTTTNSPTGLLDGLRNRSNNMLTTLAETGVKLKKAVDKRARKRGPETPRSDIANETKATRVLGIVFGCFFVCWTPFFAINFLLAFCSQCAPPRTVILVALWLGYSSSIMNPIIYTIFNRRFRQAFWRLIRCHCGRHNAAATTQSSHHAQSMASVPRDQHSQRFSSHTTTKSQIENASTNSTMATAKSKNTRLKKQHSVQVDTGTSIKCSNLTIQRRHSHISEVQDSTSSTASLIDKPRAVENFDIQTTPIAQRAQKPSSLASLINGTNKQAEQTSPTSLWRNTNISIIEKNKDECDRTIELANMSTTITSSRSLQAGTSVGAREFTNLTSINENLIQSNTVDNFQLKNPHGMNVTKCGDTQQIRQKQQQNAIPMRFSTNEKRTLLPHITCHESFV